MAKKQQIILTHGTNTPGAEVVKGLKLGEVLVQHAAEAKNAALHTALKEATETEEGVLVSFPSKEWVDSRIAELENGKTLETIAGIDERLTTAEGEIDALQAADTALEAAYKKADAALEDAYKEADAELEDAYKAADGEVRKDFAAADSALDEKIATNAGEIAKLQTADTKIREDFAAADNTVRNEFAAEDTEIRKEFAAADAALKAEYEGLISNIDERLTEAEGEIDALQDADATIREDFVTADNAVRDAFAAADSALETAYKAADSALETAYKAADSALDEKIATNAGKIKDLEDADDALELAYKAADDVVRGEFAAKDAELKDAYEAADTKMREDFVAADSALNEKIVEIQGEDAGKSMREVAGEELAKQLIPENAQESLNTLQEIAAWIQEHPGDAAEMNAAIEQNKKDIAANKKTSDEAEAALNERLTTAEGEIDALQTADTTIRGEFAAADTKIREDFVAADTALENAYKAADTKIREDFAAADSALDEKIATNAGKITDLETEDGKIRGEFAAADSALEAAYKAADSALETAYKAADTALENAYKAADLLLDEKIGAIQSNYVKEVVANGKSYKPTANVLDLSEMVIDGGEY